METPQRNLLLAFLLMALVFGASQWYYARQAPPAEEIAPADSTAPATTEVVDPGSGVTPDTATTAAPAETLAAAATPDTVAAAPVATAPPVVVETPLYRVHIDPTGGTIRQVALLRYRSFTDSGPVSLVPRGGAFLGRVADLADGPLAIGGLAFTPSDSAMRLSAGDSARTLELRSQAAGRPVVQRYRFDPSSYAIDYRLEVTGGGDGVLHTTLGPRLESNEKNPRDDYSALRAVARIDGEVVSHSAEDAAEGSLAYGGAVDWVGLRNKYFLALLVASDDGPPLSAANLDGQVGDSLPVLEVRATAPIRGGTAAYRVVVGPQEYRSLQALDRGLDEVNQYGWSWIRWMITPFAKLIVIVMLWLHRWIPDYGLVLIVFAVLVRILLWPLTTKSFKSIVEMQKLQPEIQRLRETYKSDPQRMQQETMRLYRERKVNPLGGCLPNLIPMPILFALFFVFQSTIEFRGQPFLWLPDLSLADPFYILPILMGLTMVVSSKLTMTDPKMAAMTYIMPIVLTFVFINLAAGLVLYYTVSNVLTFAQQWWLRRGAPLPVARPTAKAT
jgi:YidC/Oxa1 family membrane protein insertase